jgi:hypothetical protein
VLAAAAAMTLAGCGGGGSSTPAAGSHEPSASGSATSPTTTPSATHSATASVVQGVELTPEGARLHLGQTARVSWRPAHRPTGVIAVSVTAVQKMPISAFSDWRLDKQTRQSTPYFVHATVRNLGRSNLSGVPVPLYLLDRDDTLLEASTFQAEYPKCPSRPLPERFTRGRRTAVCLVYFATRHGRFSAISFRPDQNFAAITWTGTIKR